MHRALAAKLIADPPLIAVAWDNLQRWRATGGRFHPYLEAWRELLNQPLEQVANRIQEDTEDMRAMRQSSPFAGVLTPRERWGSYDAFAVGALGSGCGHDR